MGLFPGLSKIFKDYQGIHQMNHGLFFHPEVVINLPYGEFGFGHQLFGPKRFGLM